MKKLCRFCLLAVLLLGLVVPSLAAGPDKEGPIVILHTNDVHASLDHYPAVAGYKKRLEAEYGADRVFLVDAGDAIQGGPIATLTQGASVVDMMNFVGYDLAIPGNHEFDYAWTCFWTWRKIRRSTSTCRKIGREEMRTPDGPLCCPRLIWPDVGIQASPSLESPHRRP